jgi:hypothetical protein
MSYSRVPEEEIVPRGREIYEHAVRPGLCPEHEGKFVVIDVESGDYEVSDDDGEAFGLAEERHPEAMFFVLRVGPEGAPRPAYRIGGSAHPPRRSRRMTV